MIEQVGDWCLEALAGTGGMGEVYRARHVHNGQVAAVKVLLGGGDDPDLRRRFEHETRAVGRLDQLNIVRVFDAGETRGRPWLAMEWVDGGTLADALPQDFEQLRNMAMALFAGLAHAHSHDVIHLDVKPANLLRTTHGVWKLADFGIARLGMGSQGRVAGTPQYMAPEQIRGRWADIGPWTDSYSAGCLLWAVAAGRPPYAGETSEILQAHLTGRRPPLEPRFPVPDGFTDLLEGLLRLAPETRYLMAADVVSAFRSLGSVDGKSASTVSLSASATFQLDDDWMPASAICPTESSPGVDPELIRPPVPMDWRPRRLQPLEQASLALVGLRRARLVGREAERDRLWAALVDACAGSLKAVAIQGPAGAGRSRLASWLCARAYEVGAAIPVRVDGDLRHTLALRMGCTGLDPQQAIRRLARMLPELPPAELALASRALTSTEVGGQALGLGLRAVIYGLAARRPIVLALDDADVHPEFVSFAQSLLAARSWREPPVLIVLTSTEPIELPGLQVIPLEPMSFQSFGLFLKGWLPVHPYLREQLFAASGGLAGPALRALRDAAERGALVHDEMGYRLEEGQLAPRDVVLPDPPPLTLQLLVALGQRVALTKLHAAAAALGHALDMDVLADLVRTRLARWITDPGGSVYGIGVAPIVRERLTDQLGPGNLRTLAAMLQSSDPGLAGRLWIAAGEGPRGVALLVAEAVRVHHTGDPGAARALLADIPEAVEAALEPELACGLLVRRVSLDRQLGRLDGQVPDMEAALERAEAEHWEAPQLGRIRLQLAKSNTQLGHRERALEALCVPDGEPVVDEALQLMLQADVYRACGRLPAALAVIERASELLDRGAPEPYDQVWVGWEHGLLLRLLGRPQEAAAKIEHAVGLARENGFLNTEALCYQELAACAHARGDHDEAATCQARAVLLLRRIGSSSDGVVAELNYVLILSAAGRHQDAASHVGELLHDPRIQFGDRAHCALLQTRCMLAARRGERSLFDTSLEVLVEVIEGRRLGQGFDLMMRELEHLTVEAGWEDAAEQVGAAMGMCAE